MQNSTKLEQKPFLGTFGKRKITIIQPNCPILNQSAALELKHTVEACMSIGTSTNTTLLVDMQNVESLDSNGLTMLLALFKNAIACKTSLVLCSLQTQVRIIFEISRMDRTFTIFDDYDALVAHIEMKAEFDAYKIETSEPNVKVVSLL
jgi:anti-sigma B factor antagonist